MEDVIPKKEQIYWFDFQNRPSNIIVDCE